MGILQTMLREHVPFNPENPEHRAAYWHIRSTGRQLDKLRFVVEEGFSSVLTMMQSKLADHYCKPEKPASATVRPIKKGTT